MSRWSRRQELRELLRDRLLWLRLQYPWVWRAPLVVATLLVGGAAIVLFVGAWRGESGTFDTIRTLTPPESVEPDVTTDERGPVRQSSPRSDLEAGEASETTEEGSAPSSSSVPEAPPGPVVPATTETIVDTAEQTTRRAPTPTPAPPTVTSIAPAPPTVATPTTRPPTVTVAPPTTRPPTVTIPRPTVPPTTSSPTTQPPTPTTPALDLP